MKKFVPLILFVLGLLVVIVAFVYIRGRSGDSESGDGEESVAELPFKDRPFVSLVPSEDGHWLKLKVEDIRVRKAEKVDYLLLYLSLIHI